MDKELIKSVSQDVGLGPRASVILEYLFEHPEMTHSQIGKALGVQRQRISAVMNHPRVRQAFPLLAKRIMRSKMLPSAIKAYSEIIEQSENLNAKEKAAGRILANEGVLDSTQKIEITNKFEMMRPEELKEMIEKASKIKNPVYEAEIVSEDLK